MAGAGGGNGTHSGGDHCTPPDGVRGHPLHRPVLRWYDAHARPLPWRDPQCSPWGVLVSEVMLQQTPVDRVLPLWPAWMRRWPRPGDLANEAAGEAVRAWGRLGYPRRSLRLHEAAIRIVERHRGEVPSAYEDLLALPGVGPYTAAAVASFAFGARHAVLDTNVRRVLARAVGGVARPAPALSRAELRRADQLVPANPVTAARWAAAIMELGALMCTARNPYCQECPVREGCRWQQAGAPAHDGPTRRAQPWQGTDRQVRGELLALLRAASGPVPRSVLLTESTDRDTGQRERALASLVADGLVERTGDDHYALPS